MERPSAQARIPNAGDYGRAAAGRARRWKRPKGADVNVWLQNWDWDAVAIALFVWVVVLAFVSWLAANMTTRPPRHH